MIKFQNVPIFIDAVPNVNQLNKLTATQLFEICKCNNIGLKKILIDYLMTKKKL